MLGLGSDYYGVDITREILESELRFFGKKDFFNGPTDLRGLHTINNGIHHWWNKQIHIGHKSVYVRRCLFPKPMDKAQANQRNVEDGNSTYVGDTSAEGFMPLFWGSNAQDGLNNQSVGEKNKDGVHSCSNYQGSKS